MPDSTITLRTRAELQGVNQAVQAYESLDKTQQALARSATTAAQNAAKLDAALKGPTAGADALKQHLQNALALDPRQAVSAINQVIAAEKKAANDLGPALPRTLEKFGTEAVGQFKAGLLGIVGPAALVTTAMGAATAAVKSFGDAFTFKAQLDQTNASITAQLIGVRQSGQTFAEAREFANRYKLTQEETTTAIQASVPLLRQSKSSLTDILTVLAQLQVLKPEQGISGAAFALAELQGGQTRSLATRFNIPIAKANELKQQIQAGGDAVKVLGDYLTSAGIGAEALAVRTKGAAGALNDAAIAAERLKIAQAKFANGPGIVITKAKTAGLDTLTSDLSGEGDLAAANRTFLSTLLKTGDASAAFDARAQVLNQTLTTQSAAFDEDRQAVGQLQIAHEAANDIEQRRIDTLNANAIASQAAAQAIRDQAKEIDVSAQKSVTDAAAKDTQQAKTALLAAESGKAAQAFIGMNPQIDLAGVTALVAAGKLDPFIGQLISLQLEAGKARDKLIDLNNAQAQGKVDQLVKLRSSQGISSGRGGGSDAAGEGQAFADALGRQSKAEQQALDDQIALAKATGDTAKARKLLNQELAEAKRTGNVGDQARAIEALNALDKPKRAGDAGGKGLGALDRVDISLAGDYQAQLDAVNAKLAAGHLTELQTKQLKKEQLDLQTKIANETERANIAALDARIQAIENRKKDREDAKRLSAAQAVLANPNAFSQEQRVNAADLVELLPLEQQKRNNDVAAKAREGGIAIPTGAALPTATPPGAAQTPGAQAPVQQLAGAGGTPLILQLDGKNVGTILLPVIIDGLRSGTFQVRAAGG